MKIKKPKSAFMFYLVDRSEKRGNPVQWDKHKEEDLDLQGVFNFTAGLCCSRRSSSTVLVTSLW